VVIPDGLLPEIGEVRTVTLSGGQRYLCRVEGIDRNEDGEAVAIRFYVLPDSFFLKSVRAGEPTSLIHRADGSVWYNYDAEGRPIYSDKEAT
jgi:hypothetical protein